MKQAAKAAEKWGATDAVLLPLYPQFSSTTTGSSLKAWRKASNLHGVDDLLLSTAARPSRKRMRTPSWRLGAMAARPANPRVLFSAHGLPQSVIDRGDPYQWQVEQSVAAVRKQLPSDWDTRICYQSRVGPMKWLGPSTEEEIHAAGRRPGRA